MLYDRKHAVSINIIVRATDGMIPAWRICMPSSQWQTFPASQVIPQFKARAKVLTVHQFEWLPVLSVRYSSSIDHPVIITRVPDKINSPMMSFLEVRKTGSKELHVSQSMDCREKKCKATISYVLTTIYLFIT